MSMTLLAAIYLISDGWLTMVWDKDATKLSFLLMFIFSIMSAWCGYKTWKLSRFLDNGKSENYLVEKIEHLMEVGWFTSDLCLSIGMMGTVIGFIMMLSGFTNINTQDVSTIQNLIKNLGVGMSTALYTTLIGLGCSTLLKIQYFNLSQAIDKARK